MSRASLILLLALAGCHNGTFVEVTLTSSTPLTVSSLAVTATNDGKNANVIITHGASFSLPPDQSFSLKLDDGRKGDLTVIVQARDGAGAPIATATDHIAIVAGGVAKLRLDLATGGPAPDPDDLAGSDLSGADMAPSNPALVSFAATVGQASFEEHEQFSVHLVARDKDGQTLHDYHGTPTLSTDWGDLRVVAPPSFAVGEADVTVALDRETSPASGLAHVKAADGAATGSTPGIAIKLPAWSTPGATFYTAIATAWDKSFDATNAAWLRDPGNGHYFLVYSAYIPGPAASHSIGLGLSDDGSTLWSRGGGNPVFTGGGQAWEGDSCTLDGVVYDGQLVMLYHARRNAKNGRGLATSADGLTWTRAANNPILAGVTMPCDSMRDAVIAVDGPKHYRIFFNTDAADKYCTIASTLAADGVTVEWKATDVKLVTGLPTGWTPQAYVKEGSVYKLYAIDNASTPGAHYATSSDGVTWIPSPTDPVNFAPVSMFWNPTTSKYEGLISTSSTFARTTRP